MKTSLERRAKIVCTIGPASQSPDVLRSLILEGMNVARINFSHGGGEKQAARVKTLRAISSELNRDIALLGDLQGPKIRTGALPEDGVILQEGAEFILTTREVGGDAQCVSTTYAQLPDDCQEGDSILLDDGRLALRVLESGGEDVRCLVTHGGLLKSFKGINLPGVKVSAPAISEKDWMDAAWAIENNFDFLALSFVRHADEVRTLKRFIAERGANTQVIAKLEKPEAIEFLDDIIEAADGIMVARGDLGVELTPESVPLLQKRIIRKTVAAGKFVITATQMLESMTHNPRPTRAEASDVANAVLDGTDALMLSGETAAGDFPAETVRMMNRIISEVESARRNEYSLPVVLPETNDFTRAIGDAAARTARALSAKLIACFTETGGTARLLSAYRPCAPIVAFTPEPWVMRQLAVVWGVHPILVERRANADEIIVQADAMLLASGLVKMGDTIVITLGAPVAVHGSTDLMKLHRIGEIESLSL